MWDSCALQLYDPAPSSSRHRAAFPLAAEAAQESATANRAYRGRRCRLAKLWPRRARIARYGFWEALDALRERSGLNTTAIASVSLKQGLLALGARAGLGGVSKTVGGLTGRRAALPGRGRLERLHPAQRTRGSRPRDVADVPPAEVAIVPGALVQRQREDERDARRPGQAGVAALARRQGDEDPRLRRPPTGPTTSPTRCARRWSATG